MSNVDIYDWEIEQMSMDELYRNLHQEYYQSKIGQYAPIHEDNYNRVKHEIESRIKAQDFLNKNLEKEFAGLLENFDFEKALQIQKLLHEINNNYMVVPIDEMRNQCKDLFDLAVKTIGFRKNIVVESSCFTFELTDFGSMDLKFVPMATWYDPLGGGYPSR